MEGVEGAQHQHRVHGRKGAGRASGGGGERAAPHFACSTAQCPQLVLGARLTPILKREMTCSRDDESFRPW